MSDLPPPSPPTPSLTPTPAPEPHAERSAWRWIVPVVTLLIGTGIGFGIGRAGKSDDAQTSATPSVTVEPVESAAPSTQATDSPGSTAAAETTEPDTAPPDTTSPDTDTATTEPDDTATTAAPADVAPAAPDASAYVTAFGGAETIALPPGEPGKLSVIAFGPMPDGSQSLPVLVRNMTGNTLGRITLSGVARDSSGALAGSGEDQGVQPAVVAPGEVAWGYVYFGVDLPPGTSYEITADGEPNSDASFGGKLPLEVTEVNVAQDTVVGIASNTGSITVTGPIAVSILCLSPDGTALSVHDDYATADELEAGATSAFTVNFFGDAVCGQFLVASSGYSF